MFLKNRNIISKFKRLKVTDYAALSRSLPKDKLVDYKKGVYVLIQIGQGILELKFHLRPLGSSSVSYRASLLSINYWLVSPVDRSPQLLFGY